MSTVFQKLRIGFHENRLTGNENKTQKLGVLGYAPALNAKEAISFI